MKDDRICSTEDACSLVCQFIVLQLLAFVTFEEILCILQVNVKRIGGAYGSKLNRPSTHAMACAFAADKLQRPVRLVLDMNTNMQVLAFLLYQGKLTNAYSSTSMRQSCSQL